MAMLQELQSSWDGYTTLEGRLIYTKIDHCFGNMGWIHHFGGGDVEVMNRGGSDHSPLLSLRDFLGDLNSWTV